jgi:hypothetical protein
MIISSINCFFCQSGKVWGYLGGFFSNYFLFLMNSAKSGEFHPILRAKDPPLRFIIAMALQDF